MGQEGIPGFMGALIAAVVLGAMVTAGMVIVAVFSLL
jgi:hypothetical protein